MRVRGLRAHGVEQGARGERGWHGEGRERGDGA